MKQTAELGEFLRSRRARLQPGDLGIAPDARPRRVAGLRREELSRLAGISTEYYTRLEQGRAGNVSEEILHALAQALRLDRTECAHLMNLASAATGATRRRSPERPQRVRPGLWHLLETLEHVPAFILGRRTDVLAANPLARTVLTDFDALPANQRNYARYLLLDPAAQERCLDWERTAAETVAMLRLDAGRHPHDRQLTTLIGELSVHSQQFPLWWSDHQVRQRTHGHKRYHHPLVGDITFRYECLSPPDDPDQTLCVYTAGPEPSDRENLALLGSWAERDSTSDVGTSHNTARDSMQQD
ncbi:XRE family transcriptional regulator [Streptomyces sp. AS58]|uniref:XRE family transcriptional regulator n=1 Tax=Streptomyces cadmiisoli TaxID=2184053 RepID=A0A2Z4JEL0_9ACTN|nr:MULTISPECIES: helix-turn-helix transcriptional regulator [Streptomyces]AWW43549.1 XRE family transcriptional regulator [Streptomyces cadmiisoli]KOV49873.1 XRE family transcriptional regulator [Streptomyces sp. AS58]